MWPFKKKRVPMIFVLKSDDVDAGHLERFKEELRKELERTYTDKKIAIVAVGRDDDFYSING